MNNINEIAGMKKKLTDLKVQSDLFKTYFFDYFESLDSNFNLISNCNRTNSTFEIYNNKLKLQAKCNNENLLEGKFSVLIQPTNKFNETYQLLFTWIFDSIGNIRSDIGYNQYSKNDFAGDFYVELVKLLMNSDKFEL